MSATSIYFNGRLYYKPGSYSKVDSSALEAIGLSASGIVAVVGTAIGGKPYTAVDTSDVPGTLQASTRPGQAAGYFYSGDLLDAEPLLFGPSNDDQIEGGAQKVFYVKCNKSTQSLADFSNTDGLCMELTSVDYGYRTTQINVEIGAGTTMGEMVTITLESTTEVLDDLGGEEIFTVSFAATIPAQSYTTLAASLTATAMTIAFTLATTGLDVDIVGNVTGYPPAQKVEMVSSDAGDTVQMVTLYGIDAAGACVSEVVALNGVVVVTSASAYAFLMGATVDHAPIGTITIRNLAVGATILTLTPALLTKGVFVCSDVMVARTTLLMAADAGTTAVVGFWGTSALGVAQSEAVTLNGAVPVGTTKSWRTVTVVGLGLLAVGRTLTVSGNAQILSYETYDTVTKIVDYLNGTTGYTAVLVSALTSFDPADMDYVSAVSILGAPADFYADLWAVINGINTGSSLVTAARLSPGTDAPSYTAAPVFLAGGNEGSATPGSEGVPTAAVGDWQAALDLLKKVYVNSVVVLTKDAAVQGLLKAHCAYMCGAGKMERDGFVGVGKAGGLPETKTNIKSAIVALNTRHLRITGQQCERYNADGTKTKYAPHFTACLAAGMQAGAEVGTSLTYKWVNTLGAYQDSSWNPIDDVDEMIVAGLLFMELVDGRGFRWVRNVTSCLSSSNIAYTDGGVNEAVNWSAYNFRTEMEWAVGRKGFAGTDAAAEQIARGVLKTMMGVSLANWRSLLLTSALNVLTVSVEMAPVISYDFVLSEIHLVTA